MSTKNLSFRMKNESEPVDQFDNNFLNSKDIALQPITYFFDIECKDEIPSKEKYLSLKSKKTKNGKKSDRSKSSQLSQQSQKSTSKTNKKSRKKSIHDSQLQSSNIVIVHNNDEDDDCSSTDPIEKELEKLQKFISKSKEKKKKKSKKSNRANSTYNNTK